MGYIIEISERKKEKMSGYAEQALRAMGKLMSCIEELDGEMGERSGSSRGGRGGNSGGGNYGGGSMGNRYGERGMGNRYGERDWEDDDDWDDEEEEMAERRRRSRRTGRFIRG